MLFYTQHVIMRVHKRSTVHVFICDLRVSIRVYERSTWLGISFDQIAQYVQAEDCHLLAATPTLSLSEILYIII